MFIPAFFKKMPLTHKIAYLAAMSALSVLVNMYSIDIAGGLIKLSFVGTVCVISGALFGPFYGFLIGFLGDGLAFLTSASPYAYSPLIGISNGVYAMIAGFVFILFKNRKLYLKIIISFTLAFLICSLLITSAGIYVLFGIKSAFFAYMFKRLVFQVPVSVANLILGYFIFKSMMSIKIFKINAF